MEILAILQKSINVSMCFQIPVSEICDDSSCLDPTLSIFSSIIAPKSCQHYKNIHDKFNNFGRIVITVVIVEEEEGVAKLLRIYLDTKAAEDVLQSTFS